MKRTVIKKKIRKIKMVTAKSLLANRKNFPYLKITDMGSYIDTKILHSKRNNQNNKKDMK